MDVPKEGSDFRGYTLVRELGGGAMGIVYHAVERGGLQRDVVLKFIKEPDPDRVARFEREMRTMAKLKGPHILPIYDAGVESGVPWMALPFVEGGDLAKRLTRPLPLADGLKLMQGIADALDYMGARGYVHRDLKPANVLLSEEDEPFLADFGLAKPAKPGAPGILLSVDNNIRGTPAYMAPEQAMAQTVDHRSDIYALAIICFEWLLGTRPFDRENQFATAQAQVSDPVPIAELTSRYSADVARVIEKALAKNPDERYDTAKAFVDALRGALHAPSVPGPAPRTATADLARPTPQPTPPATQPPTPPRAPILAVRPASVLRVDDETVVQRAALKREEARTDRMLNTFWVFVLLIGSAAGAMQAWSYYRDTRVTEFQSRRGVKVYAPAFAEHQVASALRRIDAIGDLRSELGRLRGDARLQAQYAFPMPINQAVQELDAMANDLHDRIAGCRAEESCSALRATLDSAFTLVPMTPIPLADAGAGYFVPDVSLEMARAVVAEVVHNEEIRAAYKAVLDREDDTYDLAALRDADVALAGRVQSAKLALRSCRADCSALRLAYESPQRGKSLDAFPAPLPFRTFTVDDLDSYPCLRQRVVYYREDYSDVDAEFEDVIACHGKYLADQPTARITLEGHAAESEGEGTREYGIGLGERRGNGVSFALQASGASAGQLNVVSYGEERPTCTESEESCWAKNRRTELVYTAK